MDINGHKILHVFEIVQEVNVLPPRKSMWPIMEIYVDSSCSIVEALHIGCVIGRVVNRVSIVLTIPSNTYRGRY